MLEQTSGKLPRSFENFFVASIVRQSRRKADNISRTDCRNNSSRFHVIRKDDKGMKKIITILLASEVKDSRSSESVLLIPCYNNPLYYNDHFSFGVSHFNVAQRFCGFVKRIVAVNDHLKFSRFNKLVDFQ